MEIIDNNPIIFILSGKAKSGKNYTANLIKEYYKKRKVISISYAHYIKKYAKNIIGWNGSEETKPREFLQNLGIEIINKRIDSKMLIRRVIEDIEVYKYFFDIIIITDARLIEEIEEIKNKYNKTISIRMNRTEYNDELTLNQKKHITETALDNYNNYNYIIEFQAVEELEKKVIEVLNEVEYE